MKKISLTVLLFLALNGSAQMGVVTISEDDYSPYDQWYSIREKGSESQIFYYNKNHLADSVLTKMLKPYGLTIMDGVVDEDGDLKWVLDYDNGFTASVWIFRIEDQDDESLIMVWTSKNY